MTDTPDDNLPADLQAKLRDLGRKWREFVPSIGDDEIPDYDAMKEIAAWQQIENDVLTAHAAWLSATKRKFERHGCPWTTDELARRSRLWEVE